MESLLWADNQFAKHTKSTGPKKTHSSQTCFSRNWVCGSNEPKWLLWQLKYTWSALFSSIHNLSPSTTSMTCPIQSRKTRPLQHNQDRSSPATASYKMLAAALPGNSQSAPVLSPHIRYSLNKPLPQQQDPHCDTWGEEHRGSDKRGVKVYLCPIHWIVDNCGLRLLKRERDRGREKRER